MDPVNYAFDRLVEQIHNDSPEPSLVFTTNSNTDSIGFLDLVVSLDSETNRINFSPNPQNHCNYLAYHSRHPRHVVRALPYGQLVRLFRNCSTPEAFLDAARSLGKMLKLRGYPGSLIRRSLFLCLDSQSGNSNSNSNTKKKTKRGNLAFCPGTKRLSIKRNSNRKPLFRLVHPYDGGSPKHWRLVKILLERILAEGKWQNCYLNCLFDPS